MYIGGMCGGDMSFPAFEDDKLVSIVCCRLANDFVGLTMKQFKQTERIRKKNESTMEQSSVAPAYIVFVVLMDTVVAVCGRHEGASRSSELRMASRATVCQSAKQ